MVSTDQLIKAIDNPAKALQFIYQNHISRFSVNKYEDGYLDSLFEYTTIYPSEYRTYIREIENNDSIREAETRLREKMKVGARPVPRSVAMYILTRHLKPDVCIETGVRHGDSTVYILEALKENGNGHLYSIDIPSLHLPENKSPGWIIPESSRERWELIIGKAQDELPPLLEEVEGVELFFHDSHHKYPQMSWEFDTVLPHMEDGVIAAHDVNKNHAFLELCSQTNSPVNVVEPYRLGSDGLFGFAVVGENNQDEMVHSVEDGDHHQEGARTNWK